MPKKVFVSGCFDMLHSGHVAFFEEATTHGDLYVGIGSDRTINDLKGRRTVNGERERLYMIRSRRVVKDAWINKGSGLLDFEEELRALRPDIFFVNEDGYTPDKKRLCDELGVELVVSRRVPVSGLPPRSTTALRSECRIPYRLDLAGGWLDQPYVSNCWPGGSTCWMKRIFPPRGPGRLPRLRMGFGLLSLPATLTGWGVGTVLRLRPRWLCSR